MGHTEHAVKTMHMVKQGTIMYGIQLTNVTHSHHQKKSSCASFHKH